MRNVNWGCLLLLAATLAVDALLFMAARSLAMGILALYASAF